jgi:hypothetical protein
LEFFLKSVDAKTRQDYYSFGAKKATILFEARIVAEWIPVAHQTIRPSRKEADQAGIR